jgi:transcription elongation factor GreA
MVWSQAFPDGRRTKEEVAGRHLGARARAARGPSTGDCALGDLSENAEYHSAKERQSFVDARLSQLKSRMRDLAMVDFSKIPHDKVGLGSQVVVLDVNKDLEVTYKLVTSEEADATNGKISTTSPIGRGLIGKVVGDTVKIAIPGGAKEFEIMKLTTIHDQGS